MGEKTKMTIYNCPICGKDNRLGKKLSDAVKQKGFMREEMNFYVDEKPGIVHDPARDSKVPYGGKVPAFTLYLDMCLDCGCYYVAKLVEYEVTKKVAVMPGKPNNLLPPGYQPGKG